MRISKCCSKSSLHKIFNKTSTTITRFVAGLWCTLFSEQSHAPSHCMDREPSTHASQMDVLDRGCEADGPNGGTQYPQVLLVHRSRLNSVCSFTFIFPSVSGPCLWEPLLQVTRYNRYLIVQPLQCAPSLLPLSLRHCSDNSQALTSWSRNKPASTLPPKICRCILSFTTSSRENRAILGKR